MSAATAVKVILVLIMTGCAYGAGFDIYTWPGLCTVLVFLALAWMLGAEESAERRRMVHHAVSTGVAEGINLHTADHGWHAEVDPETLNLKVTKVTT